MNFRKMKCANIGKVLVILSLFLILHACASQKYHMPGKSSQQKNSKGCNCPSFSFEQKRIDATYFYVQTSELTAKDEERI